MRANIVHGAECAVDVGDADGSCAAGEFFGFVGSGEFGFGSELRVSWHLSLSPRNKSNRASLGGQPRACPERSRRGGCPHMGRADDSQMRAADPSLRSEPALSF